MREKVAVVVVVGYVVKATNFGCRNVHDPLQNSF
jgi:hypothetical protein